MSRLLKGSAGNRVVYDAGETFAPTLCRTCPNFLELVAKLDFLKDHLSDKHLSEADLSLVALRNCRRGQTNDTKKECGLPKLTSD